MNEQYKPALRPLTVPEASKYYGKSETFIKRMCQDGTFLCANCMVVKQQNGKWLIYIPE